MSPRLCKPPVHESSTGLTEADILRIVKAMLKEMQQMPWAVIIGMPMIRKMAKLQIPINLVNSCYHCS